MLKSFNNLSDGQKIATGVTLAAVVAGIGYITMKMLNREEEETPFLIRAQSVNPSHEIDWKEFSNRFVTSQLTDQDVLEAWDKFDEDKNGSLDKSELQALISSVLTGIAANCEKQKKQLNWFFNEQLDTEVQVDDAVVEHMVEALKNKVEGKESGFEHVMAEFMEAVDTDHDGTITKEEFMAGFRAWFKKEAASFYQSYLSTNLGTHKGNLHTGGVHS